MRVARKRVGRRAEVAAGVLALVVGVLGPALASSPAGADTQTFTTVGLTPFTVPAGVTSITVVVVGAGGRGGPHRGRPGSGAKVQATLPTPPCNTLAVSVGGSGPSPTQPGGGASSALLDSTHSFSLVIAGGGGGPGQDGAQRGAGGAGGAGGGGPTFTLPAGPQGLGGPGKAGADGQRGGGGGGQPGRGGTEAAPGADGAGASGGASGSGGNSGAGVNGGGRGGGGGDGAQSGGGGGGAGAPTQGGGGGGGGTTLVVAGSRRVTFGIGAPPNHAGSVTITFRRGTGTCPPAP